MAAVRSQLKGQQLRQYNPDVAKRVSTVIVEDISREGAFDQAIQAAPFDFVIHSTSPYYYRPGNPEDMLRPAIRGKLSRLTERCQHIQITDPGHHPRQVPRCYSTD